jgi:malate synthase
MTMGKRPTKAAATRRRKRTVRRKARAAAGRQHAAASAAKPKRPKSRVAKGAKGVKKAGGAGAKPISAKSQRKHRPATGTLAKRGGAFARKRRGGGRTTAQPGKPSLRKPQTKSLAARKRKTAVPAATARRAPVPGRTRLAHPKVPRGRVVMRRPLSIEVRRVPRTRRVPAAPGVAIRSPVGPRYAEILTAGALAFLAELHRRFDARGREQVSDDERFAPAEDELSGRWIEIAEDAVRLVDFRMGDTQSWTQLLERHLSVNDARAPAPAIVRPRDWRTNEDHLSVDGQPVSAALFDVGLAAFHSASSARGAAVHYDLGHVRTAREARLWNEVFQFAEQTLGLGDGTIKVAVPTST